MRELLQELHHAQQAQVPLQSHEELLVKFSYEVNSGKVKMSYLERLHPHIEFSPDLARLLGFDSNMRYTTRHPKTSKFTRNLQANIHSVYVYCDLVEHIPVGDTKAPLLLIVNKISNTNENVHETFNPVMYVPLQKKCFDNIEINMMSDAGVPVPFNSGKSFVVLEFRRATYKYLMT